MSEYTFNQWMRNNGYVMDPSLPDGEWMKKGVYLKPDELAERKQTWENMTHKDRRKVDWDKFTAIDEGNNNIDLTYLGGITQIMRPIAIHHKSDGSKNGHASFAVVMGDPRGPFHTFITGQVSFDMMKEAMNELGYDLTKKEQLET